MEIDKKYMRRCFELARKGSGNTLSNPMVGAVIVCNDRIIGEGYHRKYGEGHAEVNAIASVKDESLLKDATIYVSLEPCSHYGKTPPCSDLIIKKQIPRVVVGCLDPYPEVSGRGVKRMRDAGIEVITGVLEDEALALNPVFMTCQTKKRPFVFLKWAQSSDSFMDHLRSDSTNLPVILSSSETRRCVHALRSKISAIMVGTQTALLDNPSLSVRYWDGASPVRIVIDQLLQIPETYNLLDGSVSTLVFTEKEAVNKKNLEYIRIDFCADILPQILNVLSDRNLSSLMVEGGACLLNSFIQSNLWDMAQVETAPVQLGNGVKAPVITGSLVSVKNCDKHLLSFYQREVPESLKNCNVTKIL